MASTIIVKSWFKKAIRDLKTAKFLISNPDDDFLESCTFHCQQSIEKSIKGFLTHQKIRFAKTHNLLELAQAVLKIEPLEFVKNDVALLAAITDYAVASRYPDASKEQGPITREAARRAVELAEIYFTEFSKRC